MIESYLIQRLKEPIGHPNPFSLFPGQSGLRELTEQNIAQIWSWDYMGATEFEGGIINDAIRNISYYSLEHRAVTGTQDLAGKEIFYLCKREDEQEVNKRIAELYRNEEGLGLKRPTRFKEALEGDDRYNRLKGWLDLENYFMFFIDRTMYEKTLNLFGQNV